MGKDTNARWLKKRHLRPIFQLSDERGTKLAGEFVVFAKSKKAAKTTAKIHMALVLKEWGLNVRLKKT